VIDWGAFVVLKKTVLPFYMVTVVPSQNRPKTILGLKGGTGLWGLKLLS